MSNNPLGIDYCGKMNGIPVAFRSRLLWEDNKVCVSMYITLKKGHKLKSYSYTAGGVERLYLVESQTYSKYIRLNFEFIKPKKIRRPSTACAFVYNNISSLNVGL